MMAETQTLQFYTTGEGFTNLLIDYYRSGEFRLFEQLLGDNFNEEQMKLAFRLRVSMEGDTRKGDLFVTFAEEDPRDFSRTLYYAIRTAFSGILNERFLELEWMARYEKSEVGKTNLLTILKYISKEEIFEICSSLILSEEGYSFSDGPEDSRNRTINGVILKDGRFIECGYQDHINLFPVLHALGLTDASDWTDSRDSIHISSSQINGTIAHKLEDNWRRDSNLVPQVQVDTLWRLRAHITGVYGSFDNTCVPELVRCYVVDKEGRGGKWGNLAFLKKYYPEIPTPAISTGYEALTGNGKILIRTSPTKSLPGLLTSIVAEPTQDSVVAAIDQIRSDFEKVQDIRSENSIHWFCQEFLEGSNGVCHVIREPNGSDNKYEFKYQVSPGQGDVVKGKLISEILEPQIERQLKSIAIGLFKDLGESIQLEFVVHEGTVKIVQLRILDNGFELALGRSRPADPLVEGTTFSKGSIELLVSEILVVSEDADSSELLGKKALIVENGVEFSHILALSKALKIPSMFATGKVDLEPDQLVNFDCTTKDAFITRKS